MDIPATGSIKGIPASIKDNEPPHTDAIDDEPSDADAANGLHGIAAQTKNVLSHWIKK